MRRGGLRVCCVCVGSRGGGSCARQISGRRQACGCLFMRPARGAFVFPAACQLEAHCAFPSSLITRNTSSCCPLLSAAHRFTPTMAEQAALDSAKAAATKQSYETDALMSQYLALVRSPWGGGSGAGAARRPGLA